MPAPVIQTQQMREHTAWGRRDPHGEQERTVGEVSWKTKDARGSKFRLQSSGTGIRKRERVV
jgi:hypothetical protein